MFNSENLPSRTLPYNVKEFEMELFRPRQLALLSKSVMLDSLQPTLEAFDQVLQGISIDQLTVGDFFYLLTYQRFHCFKRRPVTAEWACPGVVFNSLSGPEVYTPHDIDQLVAAWENATDEERLTLPDPNRIDIEGDVCGHINSVPVAFSDFETIYLDEKEVLDPRLDYPRTTTLVEFVEMQRDPDVGMLADACQWIKHTGSLRERLNLLLESDDTELMELASEACRDVRHGIVRSLWKTCTKCSHQHSLTFTVDPKAFFL